MPILTEHVVFQSEHIPIRVDRMGYTSSERRELSDQRQETVIPGETDERPACTLIDPTQSSRFCTINAKGHRQQERLT
jgi:hypothetical protein